LKKQNNNLEIKNEKNLLNQHGKTRDFEVNIRLDGREIRRRGERNIHTFFVKEYNF
jgi:hypothetical protein